MHGDYFSTTPRSHFKTTLFKSEDLIGIVGIDLKLFEDPAVGAGKIILDTGKSQDERIKAIREVKKLKSIDALPALKNIVFEKTEIDVYRYEAVDALAEIETKEAFKIIADRLASVSRSGFQLRLARALAAAMNEPFTSDENTPEVVRQSEVHELLKNYHKSPPGK